MLFLSRICVNIVCMSHDFFFQINQFRNKHKIYIQGTDLPEPIATFDQLREEYKIQSKIMQNIEAFGFQAPTPIQMQAIPVMLHVCDSFTMSLCSAYGL